MTIVKYGARRAMEAVVFFSALRAAVFFVQLAAER
jgi:hypothetical protein